MPKLIKNGRVFINGEIKNCDVLIDDGKVCKLHQGIPVSADYDVYNAADMLILPGVIDAHVHFSMETAKGQTADTFESGSASAAFGGVTTIIDFAPPIKGKTLLESLKERQEQAEGRCYTDFTFHMEITGQWEQPYESITELKKYGINSVKIYTTYASCLPYEKISNLLEQTAKNNMLLIVHAEDNNIIESTKEQFTDKGLVNAKFHPKARPPEAEEEAIKKIIELAKEHNAPVYFVHVSTEKGAKLVEAANKNGQKVFGETCPHYLLLTDECYLKEQPQKYLMSPPLRKNADCDVLWQALANNWLQCVVTDHCSFTIEKKLETDNCFDAAFGIGGVETLLPLMYSYGVLQNKVSINRLVELLCENPAKMFGIYPKKGAIAIGSDADLIFLDVNKKIKLSGDILHSKAGYTVFDGFEVQGFPVLTMVRGNVVCNRGKLVAEKPAGRFVSCE